jgi:alpha-tubulin suppressor-like RCC1 family protein
MSDYFGDLVSADDADLVSVLLVGGLIDVGDLLDAAAVGGAKRILSVLLGAEVRSVVSLGEGFGRFFVVLLVDGTVRSWGLNHHGQLGGGFVGACDDVVKVVGLRGVSAVCVGQWYSLAVLVDGTVWGWGLNGAGQLGDGSSVDRSAPVRVVGLSGMKEVAAGRYHSLGLSADGGVYAWGWNGDGQLGDGTFTNRVAPVKVLGLSDAIGVRAGEFHSVALLRDGSVRVWGSVADGVFGDEVVIKQALTPVSVACDAEVLLRCGFSA